jgi:glycosyltransferase involved in cell wall biosynthesis
VTTVWGGDSETVSATEPSHVKLLFVAPTSGVRGPIGTIVETLTESLRRDGFVIRHAAWGRQSDREGRVGRLRSLLQDTQRVRDLAVEWGPDVVVLHTGSDWVAHLRDLPLVFGLGRAGVRLIAEFHGSQVEDLVSPGHLGFKALSRFIARRVIGLLLLNEESRRAWNEFEPEVRAAVVQNPFRAFEGPTAPIRTILSEEPVRLVFVGRVVEHKGLRDVVRSLAELGRPAHLTVLGDGPDLPEVLKLAEGLGVSKLVEVKGQVDRAGVGAALSQSDMLVFPTYHLEGFPTVVLEAMGVGLPIITTQRWGTADWLEPEVHALFVPPKDPQALADAIVRLADDVDLRTRMSTANLELIGEFAPDVVARRYGAAVRAMLQSSDR